MKKTIVLGWCKIDGEERRRKAIAEVKLVNDNRGRICLRICGEIKRSYSGQCREEIKKYIVAPRQNFDRIIEIWEKYHLNDMHAGTPKQEQFIKEHIQTHDYKTICEELQKAGLYEDNGYRYGSGWLYEPIPESVLDEIFSW